MHYRGARKETRLIAIIVPFGAVTKCQIIIPPTLPPGPELLVSTSTKLSRVVSGALETPITVMVFQVRCVFAWLNRPIKAVGLRGSMLTDDGDVGLATDDTNSIYCAVSCPISDMVATSPSRKA